MIGHHGGGAAPSILTVTASQSGYNWFSMAGSPSVAGTFYLIVNPGVDLWGYPPGGVYQPDPALVIGAFPSNSILRLVNNGRILGSGGSGGDGGAWNVAGWGPAGVTGGMAIDATSLPSSAVLYVDNANGAIYGGGGGGWGGYGNGDSFYQCGGGGGGGGQGYLGGAGSSPGGSNCGGTEAGGSQGDVSAPGAGGQGHYGGLPPPSGSGEDGFGWGQDHYGQTFAIKTPSGFTVQWMSGYDSAHVKGKVSAY